MGIKNVNTDFTGEVGVRPRLVRLETTDSFDTITAANYLKSATTLGFTFYEDDIFHISYYNGSSTVVQLFTFSTFTSTNMSLSPAATDVILPVLGGYFAVFADPTGRLVAGESTATNPGNIHAGLSGTSGSLVSYPATVDTGALKIVGVSNAANYNVTISNRSHGQPTVYSIGDVGQSTGSLMNCVVNADPGANLITFDVTVTAAALASGASVTLIPSSGSKQYRVRNLLLNAPGTNFSGGGGNRLGSITDGTTVYGSILAATMGTLVNGIWSPDGDVEMPSLGARMNTPTAAGAPLVFKYSGGTTDYTTGSLIMSGMVERIA